MRTGKSLIRLGGCHVVGFVMRRLTCFLPDGSHVISRIETHLSDGTTQISTSLTPETAQLLARLNPSMFPAGSLVQVTLSKKLP